MSFSIFAMQLKGVELMESLQIILHVAQVVIAVTLVGFILIQHGKGADAGAAFGSGASSTVFGSQGSGNFLTKTTAVLAFLFLANSLTLGYLATQVVGEPASIMETTPVIVEEMMETDIPAVDTTDSDVPSIPVE